MTCPWVCGDALVEVGLELGASGSRGRMRLGWSSLSVPLQALSWGLNLCLQAAVESINQCPGRPTLAPLCLLLQQGPLASLAVAVGCLDTG